MGRMKQISEKLRRKSTENDCKKPLIENNNNIQTANDEDVNSLDQNCLDQNCLDLQLKEELNLQELAELLRVPPSAVSSLSDEGPETISGQQNVKPGVVRLMRRSVLEHFPKPSADLDQNLQQHLMNVQNIMSKEFMRLGPILEPMELMGCLINCYHRQTFNHLDILLQNISSSKNSFVLINWGLKTYLSQELLGHPDLKEIDPIREVDLLLWTEWGVKAKDKLLDNVQKDIRGCLEKILLHDREQGCDSDEAYVGLYVDTIGCISAMSTQAQNISFELSNKVQEVCFQELLIFVRRYKDKQVKVLQKKENMDGPQMMHFFKTLKTCQELKKYVQTGGEGIRPSLCVEMVKELENMEAFTLKLLKDIVANITKRHLKVYFSAGNKEFFFLIEAVRRNFEQLANSQDVQERVMDGVYQTIVDSYIQRLIKIKQKKLEKNWKCDVGQTVSEDAELLHDTMSDLVPGVQEWNYKLKKITEVLKCNDLDALKMTVAEMQEESSVRSEDLDLLHRVLQWKGLSRQKIREVLDAIPDEYQPRPSSGAWYSCLACC